MSMDFFESSIEGYSAEFLTQDDITYLCKYWIDADVLSSKWSSVLTSSFSVRNLDVGIAPGKSVDVRMGGVLFVEDEFKLFKFLAVESGANEFAVIEDVGQQDWGELSQLNFFRFSFPLSVDWGEITKSCQLAEDVFSRPIRAFFVLTDNGQIGKYVNNDADPPYELFFEQKLPD